MRVPTIHMNGTPIERLQNEIEGASEAIYTAIEKLKNMTVHGRDYYPQGDEAITEAIQEHCVRIKKLSSVYDEIMKMNEAIQDQGEN